MKVPIAYYLMLLYLTVMFKPLIPIVSDAVSHTFSEAIHIATVHAIYGSNHLQKELSETSSETNTSKHQGNIAGEDQVPVHVSTDEPAYVLSVDPSRTGYLSLQRYILKPGFILKNFPPPKFS
jgi:hypothetical protein